MLLAYKSGEKYIKSAIAHSHITDNVATDIFMFKSRTRMINNCNTRQHSSKSNLGGEHSYFKCIETCKIPYDLSKNRIYRFNIKWVPSEWFLRNYTSYTIKERNECQRKCAEFRPCTFDKYQKHPPLYSWLFHDKCGFIPLVSRVVP